jgi:hypothetical protein
VPDVLYWYRVASVSENGTVVESEAYPARLIEVSALGDRPLGSFVLTMEENNSGVTSQKAVIISWQYDGNGGQQFDGDDCCFIVFRSRDGVNDWTQVSDIIAGYEYRDIDQSARGIVSYQVLQMDAGKVVNGVIDRSGATGEIVAASEIDVWAWQGVPAFANYTAPGGPGELRGLPPVLRFGAWDVTVENYTVGSTLSDLSGRGIVTLTPNAATGPVNVRVDFDNVQAAAPVAGASSVTAILAGGSATVGIEPNFDVDRSGRFRYQLSNLNLTPTGATAEVTVTGLRGALRFWDVTDNVASAINGTLGTLAMADEDLGWATTVTLPPNNNCSTPAPDVAWMFAHADYPVLFIPTANFQITHDKITLPTSCTIYRPNRYSGERRSGIPIPSGESLAIHNDRFLNALYNSTQAAELRASDGLSGTWASTTNFSYETAWPHGVMVQSSDWLFKFSNGEMAGGRIANATITVRYANAINPSQFDDFTGTAAQLLIGPNGALAGFVTPAANEKIAWAAFRLEDPAEQNRFELYVPGAVAPTLPAEAWPASFGEAATQLPPYRGGTVEPGLNADDRPLVWALCPLTTSPLSALFTPNLPAREVDLYIRRSGVTGLVNITPASPVNTTIAGVGLQPGYSTQITRFGQAWFSNTPVDSGIAGNFFLPMPSNVTLEFVELLLDADGCMDKGALLPQQKTLSWWQVGMLPLSVDLREETAAPGVYKLWVLGDYAINNLTRVDDPESATVEIDVSFNADGGFNSSNLFTQDVVYAVDGFYTVLSGLRLSNYNKANPAASEDPQWVESFTIQPEPAAAAVDGFVELAGGVYLPNFGETTDGATAKILLLGNGSHIGFTGRPVAESVVSEKLAIQLAYNLAYAQANPASGVESRFVGVAQNTDRDWLVVDVPSALMASPDEMKLAYGFPALAAAMIAIQEAVESWGAPVPPSTFSSWRDELTISVPAYDGEVQSAIDIAESLPAATSDTLINLINDAFDADNSGDFEEGEVQSVLAGWGVSESISWRQQLLRDVAAGLSPLHAKWIRGANAYVPITDEAGRVVDGQLDRLEFDAFVNLYNRGENSTQGPGAAPSLFKASMQFEFDTQGTVYVGVENARGSLLSNPGQGDVTLDADLLLYTGPIAGIEGGLNLEGMKLEIADVNKAAAVLGYAIFNGNIERLYVGATIDLDMEMAVVGTINVGGSVLFGRLDPNSVVLQADYGDLFDQINASSVIEGAYMRVYANNIPIINYGISCAGFSASGGGEVAWWLFSDVSSQETAWGSRLGVNAQGNAFCVAGMAAAVTLELSNDFGELSSDLTGDAWAGAGCGFCDSDSWTTKSAFESDKGCLKCLIDMAFVIPLGASTTKESFDTSFSCPF